MRGYGYKSDTCIIIHYSDKCSRHSSPARLRYVCGRWGIDCVDKVDRGGVYICLVLILRDELLKKVKALLGVVLLKESYTGSLCSV